MKSKIDYSTKVLEVSNLKQHFKVGVGKNKLKVKAVDGISFDVYKKEVFGIVGESGCGKTTTGRTIIKLYKPTNGIIKLNGEVIGAGVNDFYRDIKYRKIDHKLELLKLNPYKYEAYLIEEEFIKDKNALLNDKKKLIFEYNNNKQEIEKPIIDYKEAMFNMKTQYQKDVESLLFDYIIKTDEVKEHAQNRYLIEQNALLQGLKQAHLKKLEGLKESAALSKEQKKEHKTLMVKNYEEKILAIQNEFGPKILEYQSQILSKEEAKRQLLELKQKLVDAKEKRKALYLEEVGSYQNPDKAKIKEEVVALKAQLDVKVSEINQKLKDLNLKKKEKIAAIQAVNEVNREEYEKVQSEYNEFLQTQKAKIKEARALNDSKEAKKNIRKMQMIFQDPISSLNPRMTVQEIVSEGLVIQGQKDKEENKAKVLETLNLVGLSPDYISRYPHEFSGGQRQRIGIARALIMNPSIIIADEPISALDVSIKAQVINLLAELKESLDLSILFIAHDLSVVKFFCDRVAVMYFGKIVELASSEELFNNPLHGYTKSLLSAIPHPDPDYEKVRERTTYNPACHDYSKDKPELVEITPGHFVYANKQELALMKEQLGGKNDN